MEQKEELADCKSKATKEKSDKAQELQDLKLRHTQAINNLKSRHTRAIKDLESQHTRQLQAREVRYVATVEQKDAEIQRFQNQASVSEQTRINDSVAMQKKFADTMTFLKEANEKIARLEPELKEALETTFGLQLRLTEACD